MPCRWKPAPMIAVIVALLAAISAGESHHEPRTPVVTFEEVAQ
jgi:hypothetical protein